MSHPDLRPHSKGRGMAACLGEVDVKGAHPQELVQQGDLGLARIHALLVDDMRVRGKS